MTKQTTKRLRIFSCLICGLLIAIIMTIFYPTIYADVSQVAEQKSIIDEQPLTAGASDLIPKIEEIPIVEHRSIYVVSEPLPTPEPKPKNPYAELIDSFTKDELYLLYQITFLESGNQIIECQRAVIEVILNRIMSDRYPNTLEGVLSQKGQFTTWPNRFAKEHNDQQHVALEEVHDWEPILSEDYLMFALGKFSWGTNYIKIDDVWFGTF